MIRSVPGLDTESSWIAKVRWALSERHPCSTITWCTIRIRIGRSATVKPWHLQISRFVLHGFEARIVLRKTANKFNIVCIHEINSAHAHCNACMACESYSARSWPISTSGSTHAGIKIIKSLIQMITCCADALHGEIVLFATIMISYVWIPQVHETANHIHLMLMLI